MHRHRSRLSSTLLVFALALTLLPAMPPRPAAAQGSTPIACSDSPFGAALELGREQEFFLGFTTVDTGTSGSLGGYRFDHDPVDDLIREQDLINDISANRDQISARASAAADLNGDGRSEFVQAFSDAGNYQLTVYGQGEVLTDYRDDAGNHSERAMAAGDILGTDNRREQVAVASRSPSGALTVQVFQGNDAGVVGGKVAVWRASAANRAQPTKIQIATGNLDNDAYIDIVVAFQQATGAAVQLVYLEYQPGYQAGSGDNFAQNLNVRASTTETTLNPRNLRLDMADLDGDNGDEVVLGYEQRDGAPIAVTVFGYDLSDGTLKRRTSKLFSGGNYGFAMATGDLDGLQGGVRQEELVLSFYSSGAFGYGEGLAFDAIQLTPTSQGPELVSIGYLGDGNKGRRPQVTNLDLVVADVNRDNRGEIVAAFSDTNPVGFQMAYLRYVRAQQRIELVADARFDATLNAPPDLVAADWNNDSLRAIVAPQPNTPVNRCEKLVEYQVTGAVFVPPFWQNMQGDVDKEGTIGQSLAEEQSTEKSFTYAHGSAASAYLGLGVDIGVPNVAEFSASVKATAGYEYSTSSRSGTGSTNSTVRTTGNSFGNDGVVYERADYKCYNYRVFDGSQAIPLDDAAVRLCEFLPVSGANNGVALNGADLDSWDKLRRSETEYVPIARDWASLGLFRGASADQSSNAATAALAVDSEIVNGSFVGAPLAETSVQAKPWWQIDLGTVQPISKIRLWAPPQGLAEFVLLVADSDFRLMPGQDDSANLIGKPGVRAYSMADLGLPANAAAGEVTTFLTFNTDDPITGRFVRVQRRDTAALRLAEVQIFGTNHVEPDRYPADVRDTDPNDGYFESLLYNYVTPPAFEWKKVRGKLDWGGAGSQQIAPLFAARGGRSSASWSMSTAQGVTKITGSGTETNASIGVEFDIEAGSAVKLLAGGGYSQTKGVSEESVFGSSWSSSLDMGGALPNFPSEYSNSAMSWAAVCEYGVRPFFYTVSDQSSLGYRHSYTVLDYVVPTGQSSALLNRAANLANCRNGNQTSTTPLGAPDQTTTTAGAAQLFSVLANDEGQSLRITSVGPAANGTVSFGARSITYTPNSGFIGEDSFDYTVADDEGQSATSRVTVTVTPRLLYLPALRR